MRKTKRLNFFRKYCKAEIFLLEIFTSEISKRAETLRNIHQHMHFELCTFRDMTWHKKKWHKKVLILGLKFNWIHDSQSNCFIVSSPICAMRPIFFSLEFLTRLSFSTFFESFVFCFVLLFFFFLSTILTISRTIFSFADYITMKSKLACLPNPPSPRLDFRRLLGPATSGW